MLNENMYPTRRFLICKKCKNIFAAGFGVKNECPDCASRQVADYMPDESAGAQAGSTESPVKPQDDS